MGTHYTFICHSCGYAAEVSGGNDVGFVCATTTIICLECKQLYDVVTTDKPWLAMESGWKPDPEVMRCPNINKHSVKRWRYRVCPKCGKRMNKEGPVTDWD